MFVCMLAKQFDLQKKNRNWYKDFIFTIITRKCIWFDFCLLLYVSNHLSIYLSVWWFVYIYFFVNEMTHLNIYVAEKIFSGVLSLFFCLPFFKRFFFLHTKFIYYRYKNILMHIYYYCVKVTAILFILFYIVNLKVLHMIY